ncbi:MAG: serine protease [Motiliproteus sp.]|nr:serine protease [Motiliproteus sp.]MCW9053303.1 serine protease [Motiliproteus sp.]
MNFESCVGVAIWRYCSLALVCIVFCSQALAEGFPSVVKKIKPSIVGVGTYLPTRRPPAKLLGTGFVVGSGQRIITNNHVIDKNLDHDKRERLVVFSRADDGKTKLLTTRILSKDVGNDIAVLGIAEKLPALTLSRSAMAEEGEEVAFTGFPIGAVLGLYPVTHRGIISSLTPIAIPAPSSGSLNAQKIARLRNPTLVYQLDAIAYPGNSGSPLYDVRNAEVIGVLNMVHVKSTKEDVLSKPSAISYAVPIKHAVKLVDKVK